MSKVNRKRITLTMNYQDQMEEIDQALECVSEGSIGHYALMQAKRELEQLIEGNHPDDSMLYTNVKYYSAYVYHEDQENGYPIQILTVYRDGSDGEQCGISFGQWLKIRHLFTYDRKAYFGTGNARVYKLENPSTNLKINKGL